MCGHRRERARVGRVDEHPCPDRPGPPADAVEVANPAGLHLDEAAATSVVRSSIAPTTSANGTLPHLDPAAFRREQGLVGHVLILGDDHDVAGFQRPPQRAIAPRVRTSARCPMPTRR